MIGKKTCICAKCGKPLNLFKMRFVHHSPEKRNTYEGYHISQVTHPLHAHFPEKWAELVGKLDNPDYGEVTFENEILGLASEHNHTPLAEADLRDACNPDIPNTMQSAIALAKKASMVVTGTDWSGFGQDKTSNFFGTRRDFNRRNLCKRIFNLPSVRCPIRHGPNHRWL